MSRSPSSSCNAGGGAHREIVAAAQDPILRMVLVGDQDAAPALRQSRQGEKRKEKRRGAAR